MKIYHQLLNGKINIIQKTINSYKKISCNKSILKQN